jgi:hypothetical protein
VSDLETRLDAALREGDRLDAKNVTSIYRCGRCRAKGTRLEICLAGEPLDMKVYACAKCVEKTVSELDWVRPIFDAMVAVGIPNSLANDAMTFLLNGLEPPMSDDRETGAACKRELAAERRRTNALIASLTECEECGEPAEGLNEGDCSNVCAKHAKADYIEDPWAKPLRAIRTARKRAPR